MQSRLFAKKKNKSAELVEVVELSSEANQPRVFKFGRFFVGCSGDFVIAQDLN